MGSRSREELDRYAARRRENYRKLKEEDPEAYAALRESERVKDRERYARGREKKQASVSAYKKQNPEKVLGWENRRRALKLGTDAEKFTTQDVLDLYGSDCHICGIPVDLAAPRGTKMRPLGWELGLHLDHVTALANGGTHTLDNVRPSHAICNLRKGKK